MYQRGPREVRRRVLALMLASLALFVAFLEFIEEVVFGDDEDDEVDAE